VFIRKMRVERFTKDKKTNQFKMICFNNYSLLIRLILLEFFLLVRIIKAKVTKIINR